MRCQANTTELMADNAPLMRLREPEVLEKVATVLTDKDTIHRRAGKSGLESYRWASAPTSCQAVRRPRRPLRPT